MKRLRRMSLCVATLTLALAAGEAADAQVLVWKLPEDGAWARYEGTYTQRDVKAELIQGAEPVRWDKELIIKSVGREDAEYEAYDGTKELVPCRWLEFSVRTGFLRDGEIDTGTTGRRIYKVLVPEDIVAEIHLNDDSEPVDARGILVAYLPFVRGYRKVGDYPPEVLPGRAMQVYPFLTLLAPYRKLQAVSSQPEDAGVPAGSVSSMRYKAVLDMENLVSRSHNEGELWRSDETPFGVARWSVKVRRQSKDKAAPRAQFVDASNYEEEMRLQSTGTDAQSDLPDMPVP